MFRIPASTGPAAPASLTATGGSAGATLVWTAPASDGGSAITHYQYRQSADGGETWSPDWTDIPDGSDVGASAADETSLTVSSVTNNTTYTYDVRAVNGVGEGQAATDAATPMLYPMCDRTTEVRDGIVDEVTDVDACDDITVADLAVIATLGFSKAEISSLQAGDFAGLTILRELLLEQNELTGLPAGIFDPLTALRVLSISSNGLTSLPANVFDKLTVLRDLFLSQNSLSSLPANIFDKLTGLSILDLKRNNLASLPDGVFERLVVLTELHLQSNPGTDDFVPAANAGADQTVLRGATVSLDGSGSVNGGPWGTNIAYAWTLDSGTTVTLDNATTAMPAFTAPSTDGDLVFTLKTTGRGQGYDSNTELSVPYVSTDTVTVTVRAASTDATLTSLGLSDVSLVETFAAATTDYTASVEYSVTQITLAPAKTDDNASIEYFDGNNAALTDQSDSDSGIQVNLVEGENIIKVKVTAEDMDTTKTYTLTVTRAAPPTLDLNLDAIATDNIVNIDEQAAGFTITGNTGAIGGAAVTITVGTETPLTATSAGADTATWSVSILESATYITEPGVTITVNATLSGYTDAVEVTRELMIDLTAPSSRTYTAPTALQVGEAIAALSPSTDDTDDSHSVDALPSGLGIDAITGAITGTPDTAGTGTQTTKVTITDTAGNTSEATIAFPAVAKGDQDLAGFAYTPANVTFNAPVPTLTPPTGAQTTLAYTATPAEVCTVDAISGELTINGVGTCEITATAPANDNFDEAAATFTVTVASAGTLALTLDAIATDNIVNIDEQAAGFTISGNTGANSGAAVTITVGTETPLTATSAGADTATWSVSILESATYITEPGVTVTVNASLSGYTDAVEVTRELMIDLTAPSSRTYTAPTALQVGEAIAALSPSTDDTDDSHSVDALPSGLAINAATGAITGTPDTAGTGTQTTKVTITDTAGNTSEASIAFPAVAKGDQDLAGFAYTPANVTFNAPVPTLTPPTGAQTTLAYTATPAEVCTVDAISGELTINGVGACEITATAPANDNFDEAAATFTVTVASAGTLALNLDAIATDNIVNIDEKAAGFTISGNTGAIGGATVTITVGTEMPLTATSAGADTATWSVSILESATYITEPGVTVTVNASLSGYTDAVEVTRELMIDLTAPSSRTYTAPTALQVGEAIAALSPSTDDTDDSHSVDALPSGLGIDAITGAITGTPDTAGTGTQTTKVTITDTAGNTSEATIAFPAVAKGDQDLAGFAYTPANVTFNAPVPTLTPPTGAQTTLAYTATPAEVCTVDAISGELTINGVGTCEITATAPANDEL